MRVYKCNLCSKIHLEAGNIVVHFSTIQQLKAYSEYLESIDSVYYAAANKGRAKDIFIPLEDNASINMAFTVCEFEALKKAIRDYLSGKKTPCISFVKCNELDESLHLN